MIARTILKETDETRRETARIGIMDRNLKVEDLDVGVDYLTGWVASRNKKGVWSGYHVEINPQGRSCECKDWEYRGPGVNESNNQITVCKHMATLAAHVIAQERMLEAEEIKQAA